MNNDDLDKLIKRSLNNVAENITLSDPDRLLERINQDILKKSLDDKKKKEKRKIIYLICRTTAKEKKPS